MPAMPMADSRAPMVVGMRHTSSDTRMTTDTVAPGVVAEGLEGHHHGDEDDGEHGQQDGEGDLVGGLLPVGPFHQGDHAVEEGVAALGGDAHHDAVGEDLGPAGDGRAVTARLADDRGRLAGDGRLVDRGDALDDLAVGGDEVVGLADDQVALGQRRRPATRSSVPSGVSRRASVSDRIRRRVSAWALPRPSAMASAKLAKMTVRNSQMVMDQSKMPGWAMASMKVTTVPTSTTNMTGFLIWTRGSSFLKASTSAWREDLAVEEAPGLGHAVGRGARLRLRLGGQGRHQKNFPWLSCSTMGPSATAGKKVRPPMITITPMIRPTNMPLSVRKVPSDAGTTFLAASDAARGPGPGS